MFKYLTPVIIFFILASMLASVFISCSNPVSVTESNSRIKDSSEVNPPIFFVISKDETAFIRVKSEDSANLIFKCVLKGFSSSELLTFYSNSEGEKINTPMLVNRKKTFVFMPGVIGCETGVAFLGFERKNGEILTLEIPWGIKSSNKNSS
jgi:hypothetical protein